MPDLKADNINILVDTFCSGVMEDDLIGQKFSHVDFDRHLPRMVDLWSTVSCSSGSPFDKHVPLGIGRAHFDRWLELFRQTLQELSDGEQADEIVRRADSIGLIFLNKLQMFRRTA